MVRTDKFSLNSSSVGKVVIKIEKNFVHGYQGKVILNKSNSCLIFFCVHRIGYTIFGNRIFGNWPINASYVDYIGNMSNIAQVELDQNNPLPV